MAIDYNDKRFSQVESEKQSQLNQVTNTYNSMINQTDAKYQELIDATNQYRDQQTALQEEKTNQAIAEIEQNKGYAEKDYQKEAAGAYQDYRMKQLNAGNQLRALGLQNSGYTETAMTSMYSTYQNRVATARESFNRSVDNYNNQITAARLANSSALAEIAANALKQSLEYSLQGFTYKNQLTTELLNQQQNISNTYWSRYKDVENQINTENSLAEQIRQYNEKMAYQRERDAIADAQWQKEYDLAKKKLAASKSGSGSGSGSNSLKQPAKNTPTYSIKSPFNDGTYYSNATAEYIISDLEKYVKLGALTKQQANDYIKKNNIK